MVLKILNLKHFSLEYGNDHVTTLAKHFHATLDGHGYNTKEMTVEWMLLKSTAYKR
jgi:hypothetical protein